MRQKIYNAVEDLYVRICLPDKVKNINVKMFNLMSRVNRTRFLIQHKSRECKCGLNKNVCNSKQKWDHSGEVLNNWNHACW